MTRYVQVAQTQAHSERRLRAVSVSAAGTHSVRVPAKKARELQAKGAVWHRRDCLGRGPPKKLSLTHGWRNRGGGTGRDLPPPDPINYISWEGPGGTNI